MKKELQDSIKAAKEWVQKELKMIKLFSELAEYLEEHFPEIEFRHRYYYDGFNNGHECEVEVSLEGTGFVIVDNNFKYPYGVRIYATDDNEEYLSTKEEVLEYLRNNL